MYKLLFLLSIIFICIFGALFSIKSNINYNILSGKLIIMRKNKVEIIADMSQKRCWSSPTTIGLAGMLKHPTFSRLNNEIFFLFDNLENYKSNL